MENNTVDRLLKLWYSGEAPLDDIFKIIVPDLKAGQLTELYIISQKEIATGLGISIKNLGEEDIPQGFGMGGKEEGEGITHDRTHHIQNHYKRFIEECFFKLGKDDTTFEFIQPAIEEQREDFRVSINGGKDEDDPSISEEDDQEENIEEESIPE